MTDLSRRSAAARFGGAAIAGLGALVLTTGAARAQEPKVHVSEAQLEANKKVVVDLWREVFDAQNVDNAPKYIVPGYIQHNPNAGQGLGGFMGLFGRIWAGKAKPVQASLLQQPTILMAEGDLVTIVFRHALPEPKDPSKTYDSYWWDTFRVKDGKIVEHWDGATKPTAAAGGPPP